MKHILSLILLVAVSNSFAFEILSQGTKTVTASYNYVKVEAKAACVLRLNNEGEGGASLYFAPYAYKKISELKDLGYTTEVTDAYTNCTGSYSSATMPVVVVYEFANRGEVLRAIQEADAYRKIDVILYNSEKLKAEFKTKTKNSLNQIFNF